MTLKSLHPVSLILITALCTALLAGAGWAVIETRDSVTKQDLVEAVHTNSPYLREKDGIHVRISEQGRRIDSMTQRMSRIEQLLNSINLTQRTILAEVKHLSAKRSKDEVR